MFHHRWGWRIATILPRSIPARAMCRLLCLCVWTTASPCLSADDKANQSDDEKLAKRRFELMQSAIDDMQVSSLAIESASALKFATRPLLRYNDQTRGVQGTNKLLDATVWRLAESGRPTALLTLEIYPVGAGKGQLFYEFVSLSPAPFSMESPRGPKWIASHTELKMERLAGGPAPAKSPPGRLTQLRELARRFSVHEDLYGEKIECRLLTQPIDRYSDKDASIQDGAIFVFANGTNPELGLVLECSDSEWSFGAFRLSSVAVLANLDGKQVFAASPAGGAPYPISAPYTAKNHLIDLPE